MLRRREEKQKLQISNEMVFLDGTIISGRLEYDLLYL